MDRSDIGLKNNLSSNNVVVKQSKMNTYDARDFYFFTASGVFLVGLPLTFIKKSVNKQIKTDMEIDFMHHRSCTSFLDENDETRYRRIGGYPLNKIFKSAL